MTYIRVLFLVILAWSAKTLADDGVNYGFFSTVDNSFDLSSVPERIPLFSHSEPSPMPNGKNSTQTFVLTCLSETDPHFGACGTSIADAATHDEPARNVNLLFTEQRTGIRQVLEINGQITVCYWGTRPGFVDYFGGTACYGYYPLDTGISTWISQKELKKLPVGGIWKAHMKLQVGQWHNPNWGPLPNTFWETDITLKVTDNNNIRIWFPQFYGSTANVIMPIMPAYWVLHSPGQVTAEKTVEACLYDGYNSNSKTFQVTFNSDSIDAGSQNFVLRNTTTPGAPSLPFQVFASSPESDKISKIVKPGETLVYPGMDTTAIRQVMMPHLQKPVACVPWFLKLKLKPFDLSRQPAGHYTGILSVTFTPSLD